jgi:hypothetical protein
MDPMKPILIKCPVTNMWIQHLIEDEAESNDVFEPLKCPACGRLHLINAAGELNNDNARD